MSRPLGKRSVIVHFCCGPTVLTDHGIFLSDQGYLVINSNNGFETIELSSSGKIDAAVLELDRNHADVLLIAREIDRLRASIPIVVVVHATQTLDGLRGLADAVVLKEFGAGFLLRSLEELLPGEPADRFTPPSTNPIPESNPAGSLAGFPQAACSSVTDISRCTAVPCLAPDVDSSKFS